MNELIRPTVISNPLTSEAEAEERTDDHPLPDPCGAPSGLTTPPSAKIAPTERSKPPPMITIVIAHADDSGGRGLSRMLRKLSS